MAEVLFTTHDVANILRVDKSTVKRWTDEGKLKCFRTPGGHRKFRSEDLYNFISENNYGNNSLQFLPKVMSDEMIIRAIVQKKEYNVLQSVCFSAAIKGKKEEILVLFNEIYRAGMSLASIFDQVLSPTVKKLDYLFAQQKLSVSEFHLAHNVLSTSIIQLNDSVTKQSKNHKTIVCASIEMEKNDVEFNALTTLLEVNGFEVLNLGVGIFADAVSQFLIHTKPFAVCLYTSATESSEELFLEFKKIFEAAKSNGAHCVVGGNAFNNEQVKMIDEVKYCSSFLEFENIQSWNLNLKVSK